MANSPQIFHPRLRPRDKYDGRLSALVVLLWIPLMGVIASLCFVAVPQLVYLLTHSFALTWLSFWVMCLLWLGLAGHLMMISVKRVEVSEAGLRYWQGFRVHTIAWEDVEAVEEVSRAEMFRLNFNQAELVGKIALPVSLTLAEFVRIRHRGGELLFPPEDTQTFRRAILAARSATRTSTSVYAAPPVLPVTAPARVGNHTPTALPVTADAIENGNAEATTTKWYQTSYVLREENRVSVKNRNL